MEELIVKTFRPTAFLCRLLCQFPATKLYSTETIEFRFMSLATGLSVCCFTLLVYGCLEEFKILTDLFLNFMLIQLLIFYFLHLPQINFLILFIKSVQVFDNLSHSLIDNSKLLKSYKIKSILWLVCSLLIVLTDTTVSLISELSVSTFVHLLKNVARSFCYLPLHLNLVNFIFMLHELEVRFKLLRVSLNKTLKIIEENHPKNNCKLIENYKLLHLKIIESLDFLCQGFSVALPVFFYYAGLNIILQIYLRLFFENAVGLGKLITSIIYSIVIVLSLVHKSWRIAREIDLLLKQLKMKPVVILAFGVTISRWGFYSSYTTLIATYIIAMTQLSNEINSSLS